MHGALVRPVEHEQLFIKYIQRFSTRLFEGKHSFLTRTPAKQLHSYNDRSTQDAEKEDVCCYLHSLLKVFLHAHNIMHRRHLHLIFERDSRVMSPFMFHRVVPDAVHSSRG